MDSNQPIAAPLVGDIESVMEALLERAKPGQITVQTEWREELDAQVGGRTSPRWRVVSSPH